MKTTRTMVVVAVLFLMALGSCTAYGRPAMRPGDVGGRLAFGAQDTTVKTEERKTFLGQPYIAKDKASGSTGLVRGEVFTVTEDGWQVGAYADYGETSGGIGEHMDLGAIARYNLTPWLFAEARLGGRGSYLGDEELGYGLDAGAALGVQWRGLFITGGYDYATTDVGDLSATIEGASLMVGGVIHF